MMPGNRHGNKRQFQFMEGRIGVAITVLLTLSTESAGAREHLPSVSYMKAIDLWFVVESARVASTLLAPRSNDKYESARVDAC